MNYVKHLVLTHEIANTTISADGTGNARKFSSLNGVVTIVPNDTVKCIDYRVKIKNCICVNTGRRKRGQVNMKNFLLDIIVY